MKAFIFRLTLAAILSTSALYAQVPQLLNYQGRVAVDAVNFEGTGQFKFALVNADGTTTFWSNDDTSVAGSEPGAAVSLEVTKGLYSVLLGDMTLANMSAIQSAAFAEADVRLRVWFDDGVNGSQLLTPDQRLAPSVYLADGAVTSGALADASVVAAKVAPAAIDATHIAPATLTADLFAAAAAPAAGEYLSYDGAGFVWSAAGPGGVFSLNGTNAFYNGGNVGLGTSEPATRLEVRGHLTLEAGASPVLYTSAAADEQNRYLGLINSPISPSASGLKAGGVLVADSYSYANPGKNDLVVKGKVGIGVTAPSAPLEIATEWQPANTPNISISGRYPTLRWEARSTFPEPLGLIDSWIGHVGGGNGLEFWYRYQDQSIFPFTDSGWQFRAQITTTGDFNYVGRLGKLDTSEVFASTVRSADFFLGHSGRRGTPGRALVDNGTALVVNFANDWGTTVIGGAVTEVRALRITGGADLAEPFALSQRDVPPGAVVVIDDAHPGKLRMSAAAYDKKVAGIVSGADGIRPGISMIQEDVLEAGENVALSGRVYVQANASAGAIEPGDLLTTSDVPGEAMRAADHARAQGAILGKAMTRLESGSGKVLVLVTLQ